MAGLAIITEACIDVKDRACVDVCPVQCIYEFDPTNNVLPSEAHVTVAWGRDFSDVSPLKGVVLGGGAHRVTVSVDVERVDPS